MTDFNNSAGWDTHNVVVDGFAPFFLLGEGEYEHMIDGGGNKNDWLVGYFIPGTQTDHFMNPGGVVPDWGLHCPPRLID